LLGIVELFTPESGLEDNCSCEDRAGKASASRFVATGFDATGVKAALQRFVLLHLRLILKRQFTKTD
jgi:hypothetical protein